VKTPVLLIAHRRPRETSRVVNAVLGARPERIFVATDGPRSDVPTDPAACARVQDVLRAARWPGTVRYWPKRTTWGRE
jgi:hypothetical protein